MTLIDYRTGSRRLFIVAGIIYVTNKLVTGPLMSLALSPDLELFSRPLAGVARFIVTDLGALTSLPVVGICLAAALTLRGLPVAHDRPVGSLR
ncbi:MAG: hypothetical protein Q4P33_02785 [Flaviflexus sp.]|nr:hypothetical protein [Flaviflexus sp.]